MHLINVNIVENSILWVFCEDRWSVLWDSVQTRPWCFCWSLSADRWIWPLAVSWWFECFSLYTNRAARSCHMWVNISPSVSLCLFHVSVLSLRCWVNNRSRSHSDSDTWHREPDQYHWAWLIFHPKINSLHSEKETGLKTQL